MKKEFYSDFAEIIIGMFTTEKKDLNISFMSSQIERTLQRRYKDFDLNKFQSVIRDGISEYYKNRKKG